MFQTPDTLMQQATSSSGSLSTDSISNALLDTMRQILPDLTDQHFLEAYPYPLLDRLVAHINATHNLCLATTDIRQAGTIAVLSARLYEALQEQRS